MQKYASELLMIQDSIFNLSGFLQIENTQNVELTSLKKPEQNWDKLLFERIKRTKKSDSGSEDKNLSTCTES